MKLWVSLSRRGAFAMNLPRWSGKRRRSTSGSDPFSGSGGDSSDSPLPASRPVLSPPPGLARSLKDRGRPPAAAAGTPRHSGDGGRAGQLGHASRVGSLRGACLFAWPTRLLLPFSVCDLGLVPQVAYSDQMCCQPIFSILLVVTLKWFLGLSLAKSHHL